MKVPKYSKDDLKKIEDEMKKASDTEEGWVKADEVLGKNRKAKSCFVFENLPQVQEVEQIINDLQLPALKGVHLDFSDEEVISTLLNLGDKIAHFGFSRTLIGCQACYNHLKLLESKYGKKDAQFITFLKITSDVLTRLAWISDNNFDCYKCTLPNNYNLLLAIEHNMAVSSQDTNTVTIEPFSKPSQERIEEGIEELDEAVKNEGKKTLFEVIYTKCFVCSFIRVANRYFKDWRGEKVLLLLLSVLRHACAYGITNKCKNCQITNISIEESVSPLQKKNLEDYRFKTALNVFVHPKVFSPVEFPSARAI